MWKVISDVLAGLRLLSSDDWGSPENCLLSNLVYQDLYASYFFIDILDIQSWFVDDVVLALIWWSLAEELIFGALV